MKKQTNQKDVFVDDEFYHLANTTNLWCKKRVGEYKGWLV